MEQTRADSQQNRSVVGWVFVVLAAMWGLPLILYVEASEMPTVYLLAVATPLSLVAAAVGTIYARRLIRRLPRHVADMNRSRRPEERRLFGPATATLEEWSLLSFLPTLTFVFALLVWQSLTGIYLHLYLAVTGWVTLSAVWSGLYSTLQQQWYIHVAEEAQFTEGSVGEMVENPFTRSSFLGTFMMSLPLIGIGVPLLIYRLEKALRRHCRQEAHIGYDRK
jgi:hypothetical protein